MAAALATAIGAAVIEGDDFHAGGIDLRSDSPEARIDACIDRTRQRQVLLALRAGMMSRGAPSTGMRSTGGFVTHRKGCHPRPM